MTLHLGDCRAVMADMAQESVDAIVADPPYGLKFMGRVWDHGVPGIPFWAEALRVLKPGGYLLAFGGTRTYHRLTVAIEDAGFEIRDTLSWLYGSGFPKSHNVANSIDKSLGQPDRGHRIATASRHHPDGTFEPNGESLSKYEARTTEGEPWQGWGTALKPAWEPIIMARKPLARGHTVAANVLAHGTGGLNIDGCRIDSVVLDSDRRTSPRTPSTGMWNLSQTRPEGQRHDPAGRWPSNVALTCCGNDPHDPDCAAAMLDAQSGDRPVSGSARNGRPATGKYSVGIFGVGDRQGPLHNDTGGASRYFLVTKPDISVDFNDSISDNGDERKASPCEETAKPAARNSTPNPMTCDADSDATALVSADAPDYGRTESLTPGATTGKAMTGGIESGASWGAESSTSNWRTAGCGSKRTDPSRKDMKSTTSTKIHPTTTSETCDVSPRNGTTTTTSESEKIIGSSMESSSEGASGVESTSHLTHSASDEQGPTKDIASPVSARISASDNMQTETAITQGCAPIDNASGPTSRFFYCAKSSRAERNRGLEGMTNSHNTVKPVALMRWLCRMVTPPNGIILDPFAGSGTTGIAAFLEGFDFIGIEQDAEYLDIARARIAHVQQQGRQAGLEMAS